MGIFSLQWRAKTVPDRDFALNQIKFTAIVLLQAFPNIGLPVGEVVEPVGSERQRLTLVLSAADGCRVEIRSS